MISEKLSKCQFTVVLCCEKLVNEWVSRWMDRWKDKQGNKLIKTLSPSTVNVT